MNRKRILLVDDEKALSASLTKVLYRRGMSVHSAENGEEALQVLKEHAFDVIILDMRMAGMGGLATLTAIRLKQIETPVLILTGYMVGHEIAAVMKQGVTEVLYKPCTVTSLMSSIESACNGISDQV
jgi:DNA-binding NtrC family response regulator